MTEAGSAPCTATQLSKPLLKPTFSLKAVVGIDLIPQKKRLRKNAFYMILSNIHIFSDIEEMSRCISRQSGNRVFRND